MLSRFSKTPEKTIRARRLRRDVTEVEKKLWVYLQQEQIGGVAFRRQHPIGDCVLDFYAPSLKLAVECDGGQHADAKPYDKARTDWLNENGIVVLRYWNNDIVENIDGVVEDIATAVEKRKQETTPP